MATNVDEMSNLDPVVTDQMMADSLGDQMLDDTDALALTDLTIDRPIVSVPSYGFAKRHGVLVGDFDEHGKVVVHHRVPLTLASVTEVRRFVGQPLQLIPVEEDFDTQLAKHYDRSDGAAQAMMSDMEDDLDLNSVAESMPEPADLLESEDDAPIIRLINALLTQAIKEGASDIHIEPFENRLLVRMRVDGVLREILEPPRTLAPLVTSRIKVMSKMDIAEKRIPQDGRISLKVAGRPVDVRVSTLPSGHGERIVMRLLDKQAGRLDLKKLGMLDKTREQLSELINRPHGIFLVTGPTGSGKSTTLYSALTELNDLSRNILTVEDPIEYYIDGIGQTQVNNKVDMTFARGLRAMLRQDPDVVMVGEIRDIETGQISVQASLTGHMVFSTLHTNTAVGAITRMRDMGIEPFLLSSTVLGVLAQRLIRVLCSDCKEAYHPTESECEMLGIDPSERNETTIYRPKGCQSCNRTGYNSRSGIHELLIVNNKIQQMIHDGAAEHEIEQEARKSTYGIRQDGMAKVLNGVTSLDEILRVTRKEDI